MDLLQEKIHHLNLNFSYPESKSYRSYNNCPAPYINPRLTKITDDDSFLKHRNRDIPCNNNRYGTSLLHDYKQRKNVSSRYTAGTGKPSYRLEYLNSFLDEDDDSDDEDFRIVVSPRSFPKLRSIGNVRNSLTSCLNQAKKLIKKQVMNGCFTHFVPLSKHVIN